MQFQALTPEYDAPLATLIRRSLKRRGLDIPGTAYYDETLDHLSAYYDAAPGRRAYFVLTDEDGTLLGGVGLAECPLFEDCAELQKLYLDDAVHGRGLGYRLMEKIEAAAREMGYGRIYLETHTNLPAAMHLYEKTGYGKIPQPEGVVHATMNRFYLKDL